VACTNKTIINVCYHCHVPFMFQVTLWLLDLVTNLLRRIYLGNKLLGCWQQVVSCTNYEGLKPCTCTLYLTFCTCTFIVRPVESYKHIIHVVKSG
uniref:Uncharacterized protein n=1 Tax=Amphimedon queenslandica TaxID=400682 RepID=A0A1X7V081_AMPQE